MIAFLTAKLSFALSKRYAAFDVCRLVERNYYRRSEPVVQDWITQCRKFANRQPIFVGTDEAILSINDLLSSVGVSHLNLYTPSENREIWENEAIDTGIRARDFLGKHIVIYEIISGSAADEANLEPGDEILQLNGEPVNTVREVVTRGGKFVVSRQGMKFEVDVLARALSEDLGPQLTLASEGVGVLRIQSFLAQYFDKSAWLDLSQKISDLDYLVVDLRGNGGGSFPAMLRAASSFHCKPVRIGHLYRGASNEQDQMDDELAADAQLEKLAHVDLLALTTFPDYPCFGGEVVVLVDEQTSSVAEIFADSFFNRTHSQVWGRQTAGQVVMARWFPLPALGRGDYSISIPVAGYRDAQGIEIEDQGVNPEKLLEYDLADALKGDDTWLKAAFSELLN